MKKIAPILIGIVICLLVALGAYIWATDLMDSVYAYRSPLHSSPPAPGKAIGSPVTHSVVIVLIDALRFDTSLKANVMPYLNELRNEGASALMHSRPPSYSEPGYSVILTGAWPDISDGPAMNLDYADIPTFTQDDIFSAAHRIGLQTAISAFNWFEKLVPQQTVTTSFYTEGEDQAADRQVVDAALPWIAAEKYQLILIHIDQVDYAGHHEGGPQDPRWDAAATRADGLLKEIATSMDLTRDTLLVISDHGQIGIGGHGGQDAIVLQEPFVMAGKGVIQGKYGDIEMVDVAPTIAVLLGMNIPATNQGHPKVGMLDIPITQVNQINSMVSTQQSVLSLSYEKAIGSKVTLVPSNDSVAATQQAMNSAKNSILIGQQVPRGILAFVLVFLSFAVTAWYAKPHYKWTILGGLVYIFIFNFKYLLLDHKTYSLSSVIDATNLIASTALTALIALFIGWIVVLLGTRIYQAKPYKAAILTFKYIFTLFAVFSIPIFLHFAVDGATVTWTLPNFLISFLGLIFLIQILMVAIIGLFLIGIAPLVSYFAHGR